MNSGADKLANVIAAICRKGSHRLRLLNSRIARSLTHVASQETLG